MALGSFITNDTNRQLNLALNDSPEEYSMTGPKLIRSSAQPIKKTGPSFKGTYDF
jgi:hypothetical protein